MAKKGSKKNTIFIQIASYRDPELLPTIEDAIEKAKYPDNLRFGICLQRSPYDAWDHLDPYLEDSRFKILDVDYRDATGVPTARYKINKLWDGEKYTLQLDSHHRFEKNWDETCIEMMEQLKEDGFEKPLLSAYLPSYDPDNDPAARINEPWIMEFDRFAPEGPVHFLPHTIDEFREIDRPVRSRFISGHFIFTYGEFCKEVEYDPNYYFHGEEINLSVRAYMAGYDLFAPHKVVMWHEYTRDGKIKHWDDHGDWDGVDARSYQHNREVLGMSGENTEKTLVKDVRSLQDYEIYAGLSFSDRRVHKNTVDNLRAPASLTLEEHEKGLTLYNRVVIDVYKGLFEYEDYTFWAVAIENKAGEEIYREDATPQEIHDVLYSIPYEQDAFVHIWRNYHHTEEAHTWVVWPHSEEHGWQERIEGSFNRE